MGFQQLQEIPEESGRDGRDCDAVLPIGQMQAMIYDPAVEIDYESCSLKGQT
jgi:hypothetical protein